MTAAPESKQPWKCQKSRHHFGKFPIFNFCNEETKRLQGGISVKSAADGAPQFLHNFELFVISTRHNLKFRQSMINIRGQFPPLVFLKNALSYCTSRGETPPKVLYKYLMRQCESFKQHVKETDPERIKQIVARSYEDADWILKK
ncbi:unnamed protein product, partial [Tenebrio molitor]